MKRILIVTQKVDKNDDILGFFHRWVEEFAMHWDSVLVICLYEGEHDLPSNVEVLSLRKEWGSSRLERLLLFVRYIVQKRDEYDVVLVHMTPIYIVLAGLLWKLWRKRVALWYVHRSVDLKLRIAHLFVDKVFSAVPESFRLKSGKVRFLGHGIDIEKFSCPSHKQGKRLVENNRQLELLVVGRITPIKHCEEIIEAARILKERYKKPFILSFVGAPVSRGDEEYFGELTLLARRYGLEKEVIFEGRVSHRQMPARYCSADIMLNILPTGGLDKAVIEAMAAGRLVVSTNQGFRRYFAPFDGALIPQDMSGEAIADTALRLLEYNEKEAITEHLKGVATKYFAVGTLVKNLSHLLRE